MRSLLLHRLAGKERQYLRRREMPVWPQGLYDRYQEYAGFQYASGKPEVDQSAARLCRIVRL